MKRFLLALSILSILLLGSCTHIVKPYGKVVSVEKRVGGYTSSGYGYKVTIEGMDWVSASGKIVLITNDEYEIGDTVAIVKK